MKKIIVVLFIISSASAMNRVQMYDQSSMVAALATQVQVCSSCPAHANPGCVALLKYLNLYSQNAECDHLCPVDITDREMCDLIELKRNNVAQHLQTFHNMSYNVATQCERFLDRIANQ